MKKILIVNSYYAPNILGGAEISTQLLAEDLKKEYKVCILTTGAQKSGIIKDEKNGVEIFRIPCMNLYWPGEKKKRGNLKKLGWHFINAFNLSQYKLLEKLLVEIQPDIMHTQNLNGIGTYIWRIAKQLNIPTVHTTRDYALFEPVNNQFVNKVLLHFNRVRSKYVDCVVGISQFILDEHKQRGLFLNSEESTIHNIVNAKRYERKLRREGEPLVIGYFGQLTKVKGIDLLVKAVSLLPAEVVKEFVVCGTGELEGMLWDISQSDSRIILKGKVSLEEVNKQMANIDLTVVPSIWEEPFGRVIIESYNQGTPVLASKVGGIKEIVQEPKYLIDPIDITNIMNLIIEFQKTNKCTIEEEIISSFKIAENYKRNIHLYLDQYKKLI
ncbi:glycosyltransferase family 4 protein [Bacillus wiedmannii]|uniref:glycosyltransferase family 4 protein n=1 Tax=Bacillus wiedmannii TaxID=1890302 RepID=UPI000D022B09|nr:glycosyltransferase family 4 protein [Bacillus wiedmannii]PRT33508.1 glycoside hydrolase [Bacillus wiedmannii]PRT44979.1 glycoside hydrolase [Bacillus wiedmannii]